MARAARCRLVLRSRGGTAKAWAEDGDVATERAAAAEGGERAVGGSESAETAAERTGLRGETGRLWGAVEELDGDRAGLRETRGGRSDDSREEADEEGEDGAAYGQPAGGGEDDGLEGMAAGVGGGCRRREGRREGRRGRRRKRQVVGEEVAGRKRGEASRR